MASKDPLGRTAAERKAWLLTLKRGDVVGAVDYGQPTFGVIEIDGSGNPRWDNTTIQMSGQYTGRVGISSRVSNYVHHHWLVPAPAEEAEAFIVKRRAEHRIEQAKRRLRDLTWTSDGLNKAVGRLSDDELSALEKVLDRLEKP